MRGRARVCVCVCVCALYCSTTVGARQRDGPRGRATVGGADRSVPPPPHRERILRDYARR
jgi:hypothetical protein